MGGYIGARSGTLTTTTAANVQDLTATDTTPEVTIINNTHEDTDGGREGKVIFKGQQSGGEESTLAEIQASHDGTADDEKGDLIFKTNDGSDGASPTERLRIDSDGVTTFTGNIANTSGDLTLDIVGDLIIDVDGGDVKFKDDGTEFSQYYKDGNDLAIYSSISDGDIKFQGKDGSSVITPVTIDMSEGGKVGIAGNTAPKESLNSGAIVVEGDHATGVNAMGSSAGLLLHATGDTGFVTATSNSNNNRNLQLRALNSGSANANQLFLSYTGYIGLGTSSPSYPLEVSRGQSDAAARFARGNTNTGMKNLILFRSSSASADVGSITITNSATAYNTSSDHRLKENVETLSNGITRVKQLQPKRFSWIIDEEDSANIDGFLAHEAQTVVPEAVTGTHDGVEVWEEGEELPDGVSVGDNKLDEDGNTIPEYQGIDQAKIVPLLVAALQEAIAKIETLETKVAALEAE